MTGDETNTERDNASLGKDEYSEAIAGFTQRIRLNSADAEAYWKRGEAYLHKGEVDLAVPDWTEAIRLAPIGDVVRWSWCVDYEDLSRYDRAAAVWTEYLRLNPGNQLAYFMRGQALLSKRDHDGAVADYGESIRLGSDPELTELSYYRRGLAHRGSASDHDDQAIADFTKSIQLCPGSVAYQLRGEAYLKKADYGSALNDFTAAIARDPENAPVYLQRGEAHLRNGKPGLAVEDFQEAIRLDPEAIDAYEWRATAHRARGAGSAHTPIGRVELVNGS